MTACAKPWFRRPSRRLCALAFGWAAFALGSAPVSWTQSAPVQPAAATTSGNQGADVDSRLAAVSAALTQTQQSLMQSMQRIEELQAEVTALRGERTLRHGPVREQPAMPPVAASEPLPSGSGESKSSSASSDLGRLHEEQEAIQAEIQQHDQIKVETVSKYPVRVTGLLLFNAFSNAGVVDNIDLPSLAFGPSPGQSHGTVGASMRQTILGIEANGPTLAGAKSSGSLSVDFFGGLTYSPYSSPNGTVRLRHAQIGLDWSRTTLDGGIEEPLISPLSPTSYATVGQAALTWSGNLWTWAPQIRLEQRFPLSFGAVHLEGGLLDAPPTGKVTTQVSSIASTGELARQPGFEGRASFHANEGQHAFVLGLSGYSSEQSYTSQPNVHSWLAAADWFLPLGHRFELTGEAYRGRAIGGLGGSAYKNVLNGIDPRTGLARTTGVDAAGGWSQLKWLFARSAEANANFGIDDAFSSNFRRLQLTASSDPLQFYARNTTVTGNIIFHPKTYLILSPEYRRIESWEFGGESYHANVFTLSAGYSF